MIRGRTPVEIHGRRLEGPGSQARLRAIRSRFARLHGAKISWGLLGLCAATFLGVLAAGLLLTR